MAKAIGLIMLLLSAFVCAETTAPLDTGEAFKRALEQFKPGDALSGFTASPPELRLNATENNDELKNLGLVNVHRDEAAELVYAFGQARTKVIANPNSPEMQYAEQLIEGSDTVKLSGCYESPPRCTTNITTHTCEENVNYRPFLCRDELRVVINTQTHLFARKSPKSGFFSTFNLGACLPGEKKCRASNLLHLSPHCESITVAVTYKNKVVPVMQAPTCTQLDITLYTNHVDKGHNLHFTVIEHSSEDIWNKSACVLPQNKSTNGACLLDKKEPCLEQNATKIIEGLPINRACWGAATQYQCIENIDSTCTSWINQGCMQTASSCVAQSFGVCTAYSQAFECQDTTCVPQPDVCMPALPCTDGSCDSTQNEESHDMSEGVSRLGALTGVATEVATHQIDEGDAKIFAGVAIECEKHMLGSRNCCSDEGWAEWIIHCPQKMQDLHRAKEEGRALYVGEYEDGLLDTDKHYVYCIFPSKLSSIIQIQGRGAQLHIPFGSPKHPSCGGITPKQLEHIDFRRLSLSPLEQELLSRQHLPDFEHTAQTQQTHIERLNQEGRAHD